MYSGKAMTNASTLHTSVRKVSKTIKYVFTIETQFKLYFLFNEVNLLFIKFILHPAVCLILVL